MQICLHLVGVNCCVCSDKHDLLSVCSPQQLDVTQVCVLLSSWLLLMWWSTILKLLSYGFWFLYRLCGQVWDSVRQMSGKLAHQSKSSSMHDTPKSDELQSTVGSRSAWHCCVIESMIFWLNNAWMVGRRENTEQTERSKTTVNYPQTPAWR